MNQKEIIQAKCGELKEIFVRHGIGVGEVGNFKNFQGYHELYGARGITISELFSYWSVNCAKEAEKFRKENYTSRIIQLAGEMDIISKQLDSKTRAEISKSCKKLVFISGYLEKFIKKLEDFAEVLKHDLAKGKNLEGLAEERLPQLRKLASEMERIGKMGDRIKESILFAVKNLK